MFRMSAVLCLFAAITPTLNADEAIVPSETIVLFNGKDLTNFYTFLGANLGKNNDPKGVFTVSDKAIRISGEIYGAITTEKTYKNYKLVVEFKWGEKTFGGRAKAARDSGILLHCVGDDGKASGVWMESIECQMIEGGTGDFILVGGKGQPKITAETEKRGNEWYYKKGATAKEFGPRINWWGRDPMWKDTLGFRGKDDVEKAVGEWNVLECVCDGDSITNILNGTVVNAGTKATLTEGKIQIQSEGAELFIRKVELHPLKK